MWIFESLQSVSWLTGTLIVVAIFVLFTTSGIFLVRKLVSIKNLKVNHDVAGYVFANLGVIYAVLLGFTVVNVQDRFNKLKDVVEHEAVILDQLYRDVEVFPEKNKNEARDAIEAYILSVITHEWGDMAKGNSSLNTALILKKIWRAYYKTEPTTNNQIAWYSESIGKLNQLMNVRLSRLLGSRESLGREMWSLLLLGGIAMLAFIWFFGVESITTAYFNGLGSCRGYSFLVIFNLFFGYRIYRRRQHSAYSFREGINILRNPRPPLIYETNSCTTISLQITYLYLERTTNYGPDTRQHSQTYPANCHPREPRVLFQYDA